VSKIWGSALCLECVHFNRDKFGTCSAFPSGIPHAIASGEVDHFDNVEGDNGIKFKTTKEKKMRAEEK